MAVEAFDAVLARPIKKKDHAVTLDKLRAICDELTNYSRGSNPATYQRAFELSNAYNYGLRERLHVGGPLGEEAIPTPRRAPSEGTFDGASPQDTPAPTTPRVSGTERG